MACSTYACLRLQFLHCLNQFQGFSDEDTLTPHWLHGLEPLFVRRGTVKAKGGVKGGRAVASQPVVEKSMLCCRAEMIVSSGPGVRTCVEGCVRRHREARQHGPSEDNRYCAKRVWPLSSRCFLIVSRWQITHRHWRRELECGQRTDLAPALL